MSAHSPTHRPARRRLSALSVLTALLALVLVAAGLPRAAVAGPAPAGERDVNALVFDFDRHGLPDRMQGGNILHAWNMSFNEIRAQLPSIAQAGFGIIQTSPIGASVTEFSADDPWVAPLAQYVRPWWMLYQPRAFQIGNMLGSEADFRALTREAAAHGIHVIVDAIPNHLTTWWAAIEDDLRHDWITWPGGVPGSGTWYDADIQRWDHRYETTRRRLVSLVELNTASERVQDVYFEWLGRKVDAGASGFRYDAVAHIELPCPHDSDYMCSDFFPRMTSFVEDRVYETHGIETFQYGELLHRWHMRYLNAVPNMALSACPYGYHIRNNVIRGNLGAWDQSWMGNPAVPNTLGHLMVPWVESHDTYGNAGGSRAITDEQMRVGWSIIAARAEVTPLFLVRPAGGFVNNGEMFSPNGDGTYRNNWGHSTFYADPTIAAVNWFSNHFLGQAERTSTHGSVALVERGVTSSLTHGVTIVNSGTGTATTDFPVNMLPGEYVDQVTGAVFTVADGRITGPALPGRSVAVIHNFENPGARLAVDATPGGAAFDDVAGIEVTLSAFNATSATYSIAQNGIVVREGAFEHGDVIRVGTDGEPGDIFTLTLTATDGAETTSSSWDFRKEDPDAAIRLEFTHPTWEQVRVWAWWPGGGNVFTQNWANAPLMEREVVDGQEIWAFTFAPEVRGPLNVILHNGAGEQTPEAAGITESVRITAQGQWTAIPPQLRPSVNATFASTNFDSPDGIEVTLSAMRTTAASWSVNGGERTAFAHGDRITVGRGAVPGQSFELALWGTDGEFNASRSFELIRVDRNAPVRVEFTHPTWSQVRVHAWNADGALTGEWADAPAMVREVVDGEQVWVHTFAPGTTMPVDLVLRGDGAAQVPGMGQGGVTVRGNSRIAADGTVTPVFGAPRLWVTPESPYFTDAAGVAVTLFAENVIDPRFQAQGMPFASPFESGHEILLGAGWEVGRSVTVVLTGTTPDGGSVREEFTFMRVADPADPAFGRDTVGVRRNHQILASNTIPAGAVDVNFGFGAAADAVILGDWDGDGVDTPVIRRGSQFLGRNSNTTGNAEFVFTLPLEPGDTVLAGDWDGDGVDTLAIRRGDQVIIDGESFTFGEAGGEVFVGDWDGDGVDTLATRVGNRFSFANENVTGAALSHQFFGVAGDEVLVGDFDADGRDSIAIRRTTQFLVANELGGPVDARFFFGVATDTALAGNFNGN